MTDRPILFSGPMILALLDGRKTQTRRVLKPQPALHMTPDVKLDGLLITRNVAHGLREDIRIPYVLGDRLWVREMFAVSGVGWGKKPSQARGGKVHYHADPDHGWQSYWGDWRPSIHMPRWASRLTLTVTDVRVQRVQEISEDDARAEGATYWWQRQPNDTREPFYTAVGMFRALWDSINAARCYGWATNPWVVAISFDVHRCNIDQMGGAS